MIACLSLGLCCTGCGEEPQHHQAADPTPEAAAPVFATNVGGLAYEGVDGTVYAAETCMTGGTTGHMENVKGSQDGQLYRTYREGDLKVVCPLDDGTYDVTFHFAEPHENGPGDRVFDVFADGRKIIADLDVMLFRDGKVHSALTVTVPDVVVSDGELNIEFAARAGEPILSALVVRGKRRSAAAWQLIWSDEFDIDGAPDPARWNIEEWPPRKVNDEDQAYTSRARNVRVENGRLVIEAHNEHYGEAKYTSGRVHSAGKGDFLYGRFEVRAKLPKGQGTWPAIWMLPSNPFTYATTCTGDEDWQGSEDCNAWPNSGEIDIMEHVGYQMDHVHGTVHTKAYYWVKWEQRKGRILLDGVDENFHVYALEWSPDRIDAFVDDTHYFTYVNEQSGWEAWPFDHPFHLIFNIAVGGAWGRAGGPVDDSVFPQQMLIDYARVYRNGA